VDKTVLKEISNFLPQRLLDSISRRRQFNPFETKWYDKEDLAEYQLAILEEAGSKYDLTPMIGIEEWHHNPCFMPLPSEHYDKDEKLFEKENILEFPLCSCVLYMKIENLVGGHLLVDKRMEVVPESNKLVLMSPGVIHEVTDYISGVRTSLNINPWERKVGENF
jgi:hypothetical protein